MSKLVSAIITTYKRPVEIVFRAVESILNQTYSNIEIILVDDSPETYSERAVLRDKITKYGDKVNYIQNEHNIGACASRNVGLNMAKGEYIAFLDDDDEWLPCKIEKQLQGFKDNQTALVYCGTIKVDELSASEEYIQPLFYSGYIYDKLIFKNFIGSSSLPLLKTSFLKEIGGFDPQMKSAQDYDVWLRLAQKYKVNYIDEYLVRYYLHSGERISTNFVSRIDGQKRLIEKNYEYLCQNPRAWWWRHLRLALQYGKASQLVKGVKIWVKACAKQPHKVITNVEYLAKILYYAVLIK